MTMVRSVFIYLASDSSRGAENSQNCFLEGPKSWSLHLIGGPESVGATGGQRVDQEKNRGDLARCERGR